jgi:hypothetical protein
LPGSLVYPGITCTKPLSDRSILFLGAIPLSAALTVEVGSTKLVLLFFIFAPSSKNVYSFLWHRKSREYRTFCQRITLEYFDYSRKGRIISKNLIGAENVTVSNSLPLCQYPGIFQFPDQSLP